MAKFAGMMIKNNGYVLEQLFSPLVVHGGPRFEELQEIGRGCIVRTLFYHYRGFASNQIQLLEKGEETVKRLLYCYRVLLNGLHVLKRGEIEAHLGHLNAEYAIDGVAELMDRKRAGAEKGALAEGEASAHLPTLKGLLEDLHEAFETSRLPEKVSTYDALDDFVVRARLELGDG